MKDLVHILPFQYADLDLDS